MFDSEGFRRDVADEIRQRSWRYTVLGIVSLIAGSLGLLYAGLVTVTSVFVFGAALAVAAQLPIALLEIVVAAVLLTHPLASILGLTLLLAAFFVGSGLYRAIVSAQLKFASWGWSFASGLISVALGVLVWWEWPASSLWLLGTYVCVYCIVTGWAFLMLGLTARGLAGREAEARRPIPQPAV